MFFFYMHYNIIYNIYKIKQEKIEFKTTKCEKRQ